MSLQGSRIRAAAGSTAGPCAKHVPQCSPPLAQALDRRSMSMPALPAPALLAPSFERRPMPAMAGVTGAGAVADIFWAVDDAGNSRHGRRCCQLLAPAAGCL